MFKPFRIRYAFRNKKGQMRHSIIHVLHVLHYLRMYCIWAVNINLFKYYSKAWRNPMLSSFWTFNVIIGMQFPCRIRNVIIEFIFAFTSNIKCQIPQNITYTIDCYVRNVFSFSIPLSYFRCSDFCICINKNYLSSSIHISFKAGCTSDNEHIVHCFLENNDVYFYHYNIEIVHFTRLNT